MLVGAGGGTLLGLVTDPDRADGAAQALAPPQQVAASTTRRPRSRFAGATSTTRHRPRTLPSVTAALTPATTARPTTTTAPAATTTTRASTTTTTGPSTTTTTVGDGSTTSSGGSSTTTTT
jgi:hypothetical protein